MVLVDSPSARGDARAMLIGKDGRTLELPSLRFTNGEATTWLVTHDDISGYDRLVIMSRSGDVLANASIAEACAASGRVAARHVRRGGPRNVEVAGVEPAWPGDRLGLLRAQPMIRSRPSASIGRGPRGQSGCGVRRRPPDGTGGVSLLR